MKELYEAITNLATAARKESARAKILEEEIRVRRYDEDRRAHGHNDGAQAVREASIRTEQTNALNASKFREP